LRAAVLKLFTAKFPELVEPPWKSLFAKYNDVWGPEGMDAVAVTWGVPGTSSFISVEVSWAVGKNHVALNWWEGRSFQDILDMLRAEWLTAGKTPASRYFESCERDYINKWIALDALNGGPLSGEVGAATFAGLPTPEELVLWKERAALALVDCGAEVTDFDNGADERDFDTDVL